MDRKLFSLGLFVVVSLALLVWLASQLGVIGARAVNHYTVRLDNAAGLVAGNAVKSAGVEIGRVGSVTLNRDEKTRKMMAIVDLQIHSGNDILDDAEVSVAPKSLLGEKFLDLRQATHPDAKLLEPGSQLPDGKKSVDVADIFDLARPVIDSDEDLYPLVVSLAKHLNHLFEALNPEDKEALRKEFSSIGDKLSAILANTETLTDNASKLLAENSEELTDIIERTQALVNRPELDSIIRRGNNVLFTVEKKLPPMLDKLDNLIDKTDKLVSRVDGKKVENIVANVEAITKDGKDLTADFKRISKHLEPLTKNLKLLAERAVKLKESYVRQFLQVEGVRVRMFGKEDKKFKKKVQDLQKQGK